eukprot:COSAG01_NODE_1718_length_9396_cov_26.510165_7_plen_62_part_00
MEPIPHLRWRPPSSGLHQLQHRFLFLHQHRWKLTAVAINLPLRTPVLLELPLHSLSSPLQQ